MPKETYQLMANEKTDLKKFKYSISDYVKLPNIPLEFLNLLNVIRNAEIESVSDDFAEMFFLWDSRFNEESSAIRNYKQIINLKFAIRENENENQGIQRNYLNQPVLLPLMSELFLTKKDMGISPTLSSSAVYLDEVKHLNNLLWKNSAVMYSNEWKMDSNDLNALLSTADNFLSMTMKVNKSIEERKFLENLPPSLQTVIQQKYLVPLRNLNHDLEAIENCKNSRFRGKSWMLLGYLNLCILLCTR